MDQHYLTPLFEPKSIVLFTGPQGAPEQQTPQARALLAHTELDAKSVATEALNIAGDICIYTNRNIVVEQL